MTMQRPYTPIIREESDYDIAPSRNQNCILLDWIRGIELPAAGWPPGERIIVVKSAVTFVGSHDVKVVTVL